MFEKLNIKNSFIIHLQLLSSRMTEQILNITGKLSYVLLNKMELHYILMGFLLGKAMILNELSPFAVPFFAVMYHLKKEKLIFIFLAILLGSNSAANPHSVTIFSGMILYFFLQKWMDSKNKIDLSYTPFLVAAAIFLPQTISHFYQQVELGFPWVMTGLESLLGFILTLIFIQAIPILVYHREHISLNQEEMIALSIVLASVMTGTLGWNIYGFSVEHIISRYFILLFALVGGGAIGASIGVVTGLILSLSNPNAVYQISLLAFSGLLAGLLKPANKLGVSLGLVLGTTILSVYLGNQQEMIVSFSESSIALILFMLTPKNIIKEIAKFIPGTPENSHHHQEYALKMRQITSNKIEQFAEMFSQLANSFKEISTPKIDQSEQIDHFMSQVSENHCKTCWKREKCWNEDFFQTYRLMTELMTKIETKGKINKKDIPPDWKNHCVKYDQVAHQLIDIYENYGDHIYWRKQLEESRLLVSHQLFGVSQVMKDLATEIKKEGKEMGIQEKLIHHSLEKLGLAIRQVNVVNLEEGNVDIEVIQSSCHGRDECSKIVAPLISDVVGENIVVKEKQCQFSKDGMCKIILSSAKKFEIETGYASAAKDGKWLSGDSFSTIDIGNGKYAVALSDGMGNGERAQTESKATLELLQQLLHSGIDENISLKTINSVMLLRSEEEIFSTVDLAIIDLFNAHSKFLKVGSSPSFIKRGDEIMTISANNLPIGMIQDLDIDTIEYDLRPGDLLIMVTDGIYDASKHAANKELWLKRMIQEIETEDPQDFADLLLEKVIRHEQGAISDDMTVIISKIEEYKPVWSAIKIPGISKIEREKMTN